MGTTVAHSFTFSSGGASDLVIFLIQLQPDDSSGAPTCGEEVACDFAITSLPGFPVRLPPGDQTVLEVTFTPSAIGSAEVFLYVRSEDLLPPPGTVAYLPLTGVGVEPSDLMTDLLQFFGDAVEAGTVWGVGPGSSSARHRLDAFGHKLVAAALLIDRNADGLACTVLQAARAKADGESRPPDFVAGPATDELVARIDEVRDALGCP